jgi:hypothetical protein
LQRANDLVQRGKVHPTNIMAGYRLAMREAVKYIKAHLTVPSDRLTAESIISVAKTSMSSKILHTNDGAAALHGSLVACFNLIVCSLRRVLCQNGGGRRDSCQAGRP